mmetsp:Transcript_68/g.127  ORF Transcript_68/g.127 Transcript_68/m.127 type:complete len:298 (+) Transcript_68:994-1887(+)
MRPALCPDPRQPRRVRILSQFQAHSRASHGFVPSALRRANRRRRHQSRRPAPGPPTESGRYRGGLHRHGATRVQTYHPPHQERPGPRQGIAASSLSSRQGGGGVQFGRRRYGTIANDQLRVGRSGLRLAQTQCRGQLRLAVVGEKFALRFARPHGAGGSLFGQAGNFAAHHHCPADHVDVVVVVGRRRRYQQFQTAHETAGHISKWREPAQFQNGPKRLGAVDHDGMLLSHLRRSYGECDECLKIGAIDEFDVVVVVVGCWDKCNECKECESYQEHENRLWGTRQKLLRMLLWLYNL